MHLGKLQHVDVRARRMQICVPKRCQIITPVPEDLRTTSTLLAPKPPQRSSATNGKPYSPLLMSVGGGLSAPSQAVSYHVTSLLAASQLLVTRGNAALGSHLLLLCLVCGVRSLGSLIACRRHRRVAQVHERRSAATMGALAALFDIEEEASSRLRARTVVNKIIEGWLCSNGSLTKYARHKAISILLPAHA